MKYILNENANMQYLCQNYTVPLTLFCNLLKVVSYGKTLLKFSQVETCPKNYHTKLSYTKPGNSLIKKSKFLDSKIRLFHGLISFQRGWRNFLHSYTHIQNTKKYQRENYKDFCADKKWHYYVVKKKKYLRKSYKGFQLIMMKE